MYEKAVRAVAKQRVALEVLSYHASAPPEDVVRIKVGIFHYRKQAGLLKTEPLT